MNIRVVAISDLGSFLAVDAETNYYVLTLDDSRTIDCDDVLRGTFDGRGSLFFPVHNLTKRDDVRICLENWECPLNRAVESLLSFRGTKTVVAGGRPFDAHSDAAVQALREAIQRS